MSELDQKMTQLVAVLTDEAKEIALELKDISTKIDAERKTGNKTSLNHND